MRQRIGRIAKLINVKSAWNFTGQARRHVLIIFRMTARYVGARQPNFGTKRAHVRDFLLRHLVRYNENTAITFGRGDQRQPQPGIAGSRLDNRAAGYELAIPLGRFNHGERDPIFDRTGRILIFQLQKKVTGPGVDARHFEQRSVADERENRGRMINRF